MFKALLLASVAAAALAVALYLAYSASLDDALRYAQMQTTLWGKIGALAHYDVVKTTEPRLCSDGVANFTCFLSKTDAAPILEALGKIGVRPEVAPVDAAWVLALDVNYTAGGFYWRNFTVLGAWELRWNNQTARVYQVPLRRSYGELLKVGDKALRALLGEGASGVAVGLDKLVVYVRGRPSGEEIERIVQAVKRIDPGVDVVVVPGVSPEPVAGGPTTPSPVPIAGSAPPIAAGPSLDAYGRFAVELYKRAALGRLNENIALSPYSAYKAFAMAYAGAAGSTKEEMRRVFGFGDDPCVLPPAGRGLEDAASAWLQKGFPFKQSYLEKLRCVGEVEWADFANDYASASRGINDWVAEKTRGLVRDLLPPGYPEGERVRAVLVSAVFFNGTWWPEGFERIGKRDFAGVGPVEFMGLYLTSCTDPSLRGKMAEDFAAVELPFNGSDLALYVIAPRDLASFVEGLSYERLRAIISSLDEEVAAVEMPLFRAEFKGSVKQLLMEMGVVEAFDKHRANFAEMADAPLYIDDVFHGAYVKADENGVLAGAATAVVFKPVCAKAGGAKIVVDRPFLFVLADRHSGVIYFIGHVADPSR